MPQVYTDEAVEAATARSEFYAEQLEIDKERRDKRRKRRKKYLEKKRI